MRLSKKDYIITLIVAYGFLFMLYILLKKEELVKKPCSWEKPCVRFCCEDMTLCKDDFIRMKFKVNFSHEKGNSTYLILHETPECQLKDLGTDIQNFSNVSAVIK
jgi:hypothetical protein